MTRSAARKSDEIGCVLLTAGGSRRLGRAKQLVRYRGRPLIVNAIAAARSALPHGPLVVVIGAQALRLRLVLRRARCGVQVVMNSRWEQGLATSLRAGLTALPAATRAALVLLVDQPLVDAPALKRLLKAWRRRPGLPAAACYEGRSGVPAVLPRGHWRAVKAVQGDEGARALLRRSRALTLVDLPEAALDIDTPADAAKLER